MNAQTANSNEALFVYGSLLDEARRAELLGRKVTAERARLLDYERQRARYFYIVARAGAETSGLVLSRLGARDFAALDRYEEVPRLYTRVEVEVIVDGGAKRRCWVYLPAPALLAGQP